MRMFVWGPKHQGAPQKKEGCVAPGEPVGWKLKNAPLERRPLPPSPKGNQLGPKDPGLELWPLRRTNGFFVTPLPRGFWNYLP